MSTEISSVSNTHTPEVVDGYKAVRESNNIVHKILGSNAPAITLREADLRTGTMTALFTSLSDAQALEDDLTAGITMTFNDTDIAAVALNFIPVGEVVVELEDETRKHWLVTFGYQEVV